MFKPPRAGILAGSLLVLGLAVAPRSDEPASEPATEAEYEAAVARQSMRENCLICHSEEMIASQRLTRAQWQGEVEKMVGWGAPLPKDRVAPLIDFLAQSYPTGAPRPEPKRLTHAEALALEAPGAGSESVPIGGGDPLEGARLHAENCANCHGPGSQGAELGPNLIAKPVLLRSAEFQTVIRDGRGRMPAFGPVLKPAQLTDLLAWLRLQRPPRAGPPPN